MKIAIQGHPTRGCKVISILESLGGKNVSELTGVYETFYYINDKNEICDDHKKYFPSTYKFYTLEEFEKEFPFKIGDKVIHKEFNDFFEVISFNPESPYPYKIKGVCEFNTKSHVLTKLQPKMKEERNITLTLDKAKEWYNKGGELKEIALQAYSKEELLDLPNNWIEFYNMSPYKHVIDSSLKAIDENFAGKYVEPFKAFLKLKYLRDYYVENYITHKWPNAHAIVKIGIVAVIPVGVIGNVLTFPTKELAFKFSKNFEDLIIKAGNLI